MLSECGGSETGCMKETKCLGIERKETEGAHMGGLHLPRDEERIGGQRTINSAFSC